MTSSKLILPKGRKIAEINKDLADLIFRKFEKVKQNKSKLSKMFLGRSHTIGYVGTQHENHMFASLAFPTEGYYKLLTYLIQENETEKIPDVYDISKKITGYRDEVFNIILNFKKMKNIHFLKEKYTIQKYIYYPDSYNEFKICKNDLPALIRICEEKICNYLERIDSSFDYPEIISNDGVREQYEKIESGMLKISWSWL